MEKAYRTILIISASLAAICLLMLGDNFVGDSVALTISAYALWQMVFTVLFSLVIGFSYYMVKRKGNAYAGILTFSILFTAFLFTMDSLVWDVPATPQPLARSIFEVLVYGTAYVGIFFFVFSAVYFALDKTLRFIGRSANK